MSDDELEKRIFFVGGKRRIFVH